MDKITRKKLELELILAAEEILSRQNELATGKIRKVLKEHSRQVAKKFARAVKSVEKKAAKTKPATKAKRGRPVKKAVVPARKKK